MVTERRISELVPRIKKSRDEIIAEVPNEDAIRALHEIHSKTIEPWAVQRTYNVLKRLPSTESQGIASGHLLKVFSTLGEDFYAKALEKVESATTPQDKHNLIKGIGIMTPVLREMDEEHRTRVLELIPAEEEHQYGLRAIFEKSPKEDHDPMLTVLRKLKKAYPDFYGKAINAVIGPPTKDVRARLRNVLESLSSSGKIV